jgi:PTS system mannose-specific IIA component
MKVVGTVLVTHGALGDELVAVAEKIVGKLPYIKAVSVGWHNDVEDAKTRIKKAIKEVDQGKGVIILTDMFGGTPSNVAMSLMAANKVDVVTGVNLPMVVKLGNQKGEETLSKLATVVRDLGKRQIARAGELLGE